MQTMNPVRPRYTLAALTSHPIQYQAPLFRALAATGEVQLKVLFCSDIGLRRHRDATFGTDFAWDVPLVEGYDHTFLKNFSPRPNPSRFFGCINPGIARALAAQPYDAVWVHGWALASCWLGFAACRRLGLPILLRGESNGLRDPAGLKGLAKRALLPQLFRRVSAFLAVGANNADFYAHYGAPRERIFSAPYAVDNAFFLARAAAAGESPAALREREGIRPDLPVILFCGKFAGYKRPMDLLHAFLLLSGAVQASLVFVGAGPLQAEMRQYVTEHRLEHVHFLGFRNQSELPRCYAMADVFVLPSGFEPWGLVVNEAMCAGLPVIVSDQVGAGRDLVRDGVNGFLYPAGNCELLAGRLRSVIAQEDTRRRMGLASRRIIEGWGIPETVRGVLEGLEYATRPASRPVTVP